MKKFLGAVLACAWMIAVRPCFAADPLNSTNHPAADGREDAHNEVNVVPVAGGTTDIGFGGGYFAAFTRLARGIDPYIWKIESAGLFTFKLSGSLTSPYQDVWFRMTIPRFMGEATRLEVRPSYTREATLGYYGIGNASTDNQPPGTGSSYFWYDRGHPAINVDLYTRVADHVAVQTGVRYTYNALTIDPNTKLAQDMQSTDPEVRSLLGPFGAHSVMLFTYGIRWDDRDNEVSPNRGTFAEGTFKVSPGGFGEFPRRYAQANITYRRYLTLIPQRLVLAVRGVADLLIGDAPFYELARFDDSYALGGSEGVRGIPAQRYSGKVKVFGNAELRASLVSFRALGKSLRFGIAAFGDGGRVWADLSPHPELDGTGVGIKYGVGGGARLYSGNNFVIRADVAWSPDAKPLGGYFTADEVF